MKRRLLILFFVMSIAVMSNAQTFVAPGEGTLSAAISEAQDGDVLELVAGGEYTESALSKLVYERRKKSGAGVFGWPGYFRDPEVVAGCLPM